MATKSVAVRSGAMENVSNNDGPISNWIWQAMAPADRDVLRPHARRRVLARGDILMNASDHVDLVYFPVTADIANVIRLSDGLAGMATTVGRDGVTGLAAFLANEPLGWDILVQIGGEAWSLPADRLRQQTMASPDLQALLMRLTHKNQVEAAVNAVCNLRHPVMPRLARWLLTTQDRTGVAEFSMTQEEIGALLGVQRTTMNEAFQELSSHDAIVISRGKTRIGNRTALKRCACECYGAMKLAL